MSNSWHPFKRYLFGVLCFVIGLQRTEVSAAVHPADDWNQFIQRQFSGVSARLGITFEGSAPYQRNASEGQTPASVMKMLTAIAALENLGPHFQFQNRFEVKVAKKQEGRSFARSPVFYVSADPTWGSASQGETVMTRVDRVAEELLKQGVTEVRGPIAVQSLRPELENLPRPALWPAGWETHCYAGIVTPFILNHNCAELRIQGAKAQWRTSGFNTPVSVVVSTKIKFPQVLHTLDSKGWVSSYQVRVPSGYAGSLNLPVHDSKNALRTLFKRALQARKIAYREDLGETPSADTALVVDLNSKKLSEMLAPFLRRSTNIFGDRLFYELGADLIRNTAIRISRDSESVDQWKVFDGSGLVRDNRVPPKGLWALLDHFRSHSHFEIFYQSLAISGNAGTIRNRLKNPVTIGRVFAKTGTLTRIANLAGYYVTKLGAIEPFVVLNEIVKGAKAPSTLTDALVLEFAKRNQNIAGFRLMAQIPNTHQILQSIPDSDETDPELLNETHESLEKGLSAAEQVENELIAKQSQAPAIP